MVEIERENISIQSTLIIILASFFVAVQPESFSFYSSSIHQHYGSVAAAKKPNLYDTEFTPKTHNSSQQTCITDVSLFTIYYIRISAGGILNIHVSLWEIFQQHQDDLHYQCPISLINNWKSQKQESCEIVTKNSLFQNKVNL